MSVGPMVPLTTAPNAFTAKVLAARLGSEGIVWELRGAFDGPYPMGAVQVLVAGSDLLGAQELLLADEIEDSCRTVDDELDGWPAHRPDGAAGILRTPAALWFVLAAIVSTALLNLSRLFTGL